MELLLIFHIVFSPEVMNAQASLDGIWNMGQDNTTIEITEDNVYEGRIASSDNTNAKIGNIIPKDVKSVGGKWKGKMYSPKRNEWYDAVIALEEKQLLLTVGSGFKSKTLKWTKE
ncbi:hypothetical protein SAMN05192553_101304 [Cyclobacterium xiamenense]|uniref:Uncharacterized protein n=1 Tax=Cyclobacterium xiamenense TaxID=1297121 RepID=A0A1H6TGR2_9BACT|nr:DUF2147 domain-containing protein [Cyclobacterium xiamenense]SEI79218.1 hypothetical protein SAMN05192553_101304 [Cyclobacterium xiamenense]